MKSQKLLEVVLAEPRDVLHMTVEYSTGTEDDDATGVPYYTASAGDAQAPIP